MALYAVYISLYAVYMQSIICSQITCSVTRKVSVGYHRDRRTCKSISVKEVFIASVLCQDEMILSNQINRTNELLNKLCKENGFIYISNSNITPLHLFKDGIHLNDIGTFKIEDNFVKHVNENGFIFKCLKCMSTH